MEQLLNTVRRLAAEFFPEMVELRRHFHANPELSKEEFRTSSRIEAELTRMEIPCARFDSHTGIVGWIRGNEPGTRVIALRADMDALPVIEKNDVPYISTVPGIMHACGHDVHMASLLGCAKILKALSQNYHGTVKLLFQPSEEVSPGGAIQMINDGVLSNPDVDLIIAQHVFPDLDSGKAGMKPGAYMAATNEFYVTVHGKGGHAATPDLNIDPVVIAAQIIIALQQVTSRFVSPLVPTVVSVGKIQGGTRPNVIPDTVILEGIIRTFDETWRQRIREHIVTICHSVAEASGGHCTVHFNEGYPALVNDNSLTLRVLDHAREYLGEDHVEILDQRMTSEDFAFYTQRIPGCFYRLGIKNQEKGIVSNLHTATFNVDERSLETGMGLMAWITLRELMR